MICDFSKIKNLSLPKLDQYKNHKLIKYNYNI